MTNFQAHPITSRLINRLRQAVTNDEDEISYGDLNQLAETNVQESPGYGYLVTARNRVQEDFGDVWKCRTNIGIFLLPHGDRARWGNKVTNRKIIREVSRGKKIMVTTDVSKCTKEDINQLNSGAARMMIYKMIGERATQRRLEVATTSDPEERSRFSLERVLGFLGLKKTKKKNKPDSPDEGTTSP